MSADQPDVKCPDCDDSAQEHCAVLKFVLALNECKEHKFQCISLEEVGHGGTRLTDGKCCGRWTQIRSWPMTAHGLRSAAEEFENAAEMLEREVAR